MKEKSYINNEQIDCYPLKSAICGVLLLLMVRFYDNDSGVTMVADALDDMVEEAKLNGKIWPS